MKVYIGTKIVRAEPCTQTQFEVLKQLCFPSNYNPNDAKVYMEDNKFSYTETNKNGYIIEYEDGYKSWSPKDTFERCYREITENEKYLITSIRQQL